MNFIFFFEITNISGAKVIEFKLEKKEDAIKKVNIHCFN